MVVLAVMMGVGVVSVAMAAVRLQAFLSVGVAVVGLPVNPAVEEIGAQAAGVMNPVMLSVSLGFAAGAMLYVVFGGLLPACPCCAGPLGCFCSTAARPCCGAPGGSS
mgnify:CR=1 FL=1